MDGDGVDYYDDCDDYDPNNWYSCGSCLDGDGDTWYNGCDTYATISGPDCNNNNANAWVSCATCVDSDSDAWYVGCDQYATVSGPDCNDNNANAWVSCATCVDSDSDTWYNGCDTYATVSGPDCNDSSPSIHPGAAETAGDGIDQNCDAKDMCYQDNDNDNYGTATTANGLSLNCSADANRAPTWTDCNDSSFSINPGATETVGDGIDQNCDGKDLCYLDNDNDNFGTSTTVNGFSMNCSTDANRAPVSTDCNDSNPTIAPGAPETVADGIDQDCDSRDMCYTDFDNDNYGTGTTVNGMSLNCSTDVNRAPNSSDCNDNSNTIYPGRAETVADGIDQNCDGVDLCYVDNDNDNYGTSATVNGLTLSCSTDANRAPTWTDCNDSNPNVYPGRAEFPGDGIDQDCDAKDMCYLDNDNDNYGIAVTANGFSLSCLNDTARAPNFIDCNDSMGIIYPGATEIVADGLDENCDGMELCYKDADNDNFRPDFTSTVASGNMSCMDFGEAMGLDPTGDCNDADPTINPGAAEVLCDTIDNDCTALTEDDKDTDNDLATYCSGDCDDNNANAWVSCAACIDADSDSWYVGCDQYATVSGPDCNDAAISIYSNAPELCDGIDNQCSGDVGSGTIDEGCTMDTDSDGLTDAEEGALGTDRLDPDTDDDGLNDGAEVSAGTHPLIADSDGDGWLDGVEVQRGTDPLVAASHPLPAGPDQLFNYQGRLMNGAGLPANGPVAMTFGIYAGETGGAPIWSESQTVTVNQGIYNVLLGSLNPLDATDFVAAQSPAYYLQVTVGGETLSPRQRLGAVMFALAASQLFDGRLEMDGRTLTIGAAAAVKTVHVNFNQAFFAPPRVVVSPLDDEIGTVPFSASKLRNITATGFDVTFRSMTGATAAGAASFTYQAFGN